MGWTFGYKDKAELTRKIIGNGKDGDFGEGFSCIAYAETIHSPGVQDVIWTVQQAPNGERFIVCNLLEMDWGDIQAPPSQWSWGYKVIEESAGPCFYSIPLEFLDLAPCPGMYGTHWREKVRAYQYERAPIARIS